MRHAAVLLGIVLASFAAGAFGAGETWQVDPAHSFVMFRIKHLGAAWVYGRFNQFAGTIVHDPDDPAKSSVEVTVQTPSVDTAVEARDKHLRSPDFFGVAKHAAMSLKSTAVKPTGKGAWDVTGDLTLLGVTRRIMVPVRLVGQGKDRDGKPIVGLEVQFSIKRSDYGMTHLVGPVGDEVHITLAVECKKADGK